MNLEGDITYRWLTFTDGRMASWKQMLSAEERQRLDCFGHAGRRREFVTGRAAVRSLLGNRLGCPPEQVPLRVTASGALDVQHAPHHVSLAHSGPHAVAVAAAHPVGVDLEQIAPRDAGVDRFLLHPNETELLDALPLDRDRGLILIWTLKEATLKGLRTGFRLSPKKIRLEVYLDQHRATAFVNDDQQWQLRFAEREGYYWSVATPAKR